MLMMILMDIFTLLLIKIDMKKEYIVFYLSADGRFHGRTTVLAVSFSSAYKDAKLFSRDSGCTLVGLVERQTFKYNCLISNY